MSTVPVFLSPSFARYVSTMAARTLGVVLICQCYAMTQPPQPWLTLDARVLEVNDGNRLRVADGKGVVHQIRLSGSDAPELSQPGGMDAKRRLTELVEGKHVRIIHRWFDRRGRILGKVYQDDIWVNEVLIKEGRAWFYDPDGDTPELGPIFEKAKSEKVGIWARERNVPPWWYRLGDISYREGMETKYPRLYPRKKSSNERSLLGVGTP